MKKWLQSYMVFTSTGYRIGSLILLPLAVLSFSILLLCGSSYMNGIFPEYLLTSYVVAFELLSDFWLFSGICSRDGKCLDYIKTSRCGIRLLRRGVVGDLIRRFVYMMIFAAVCYYRTGLLQDFATVLIAYIIVVAALNLTRYISVLQMHMAISMGAVFLFLILSVLCWFAMMVVDMAVWAVMGELAVLLILAVGASVVTVWHMDYRVKGSYYEK